MQLSVFSYRDNYRLEDEKLTKHTEEIIEELNRLYNR